MRTLAMILLVVLPAFAFCQDGDVQFNVKKNRDTVPYLSSVYACPIVKVNKPTVVIKTKSKKSGGKNKEKEIAKAVIQFFPNGLCKIYCIDLNRKSEIIKQTETKDFTYTISDSTIRIYTRAIGKVANNSKLVFYGKQVANQRVEFVNNGQFITLFNNKNYSVKGRPMVFMQYNLNS